MVNTSNTPFKNKLMRLINLGVGLAAIDGGAIIAIQTLNFLATYFGIKIPNNVADLQSVEGVGRTAMLVFIFSILNISVIIYRILGLTRGVKNSLPVCYMHAVRKLSSILLLFIIACITLVAISPLVSKLLGDASGNISQICYAAILLLQFMLIPFGLLCCIFIIDQNKNPLQSIAATYRMIRYKVSFNLLATLSLLYSLPFVISVIFSATALASYISLLTAMWLLYCHIITIVIYADSLDKNEAPQAASKTNKGTKTVVI